MHRVAVLPTVVAAAVAVALAGFVPAAQAGSLATKNSCKWSIDDYYRDLDIGLAGTGSPSPVQPGGAATLASSTASSRIPDYVADRGYNLGLLTAGRNDIPATVWVATSANGQTQVTTATVTVTTVITVDGDQNFKSATPMDVTLPLADTSWTAPQSGALTFAQAPAGSLPPLPTGPNGANRTPVGSIVILAALSNSVRLALDCQPGTSVPGGKGVTPAAASPFESLPLPAAAPGAPPATTPTSPTTPTTPTKPVVLPSATPPPAAAVRSLKLKISGRTDVPLSIGCGKGAGACFGAIEVRTATKQRIGKRLAYVTVARGSYSVGAGSARKIELTASDAIRAVLKRKPSVAVQVRLVPQAPSTAPVVVKRLVLVR